MAALDQTVYIWRGDSLTIRIAVKDKAGAAVSLAGATIKFQIAADFTRATAPLVSKALGSGIAVNGSEIVVTINPADTEGMAPGYYAYEAEVNFPSGTVYTVAQGKFLVHPTMVANA